MNKYMKLTMILLLALTLLCTALVSCDNGNTAETQAPEATVADGATAGEDATLADGATAGQDATAGEDATTAQDATTGEDATQAEAVTLPEGNETTAPGVTPNIPSSVTMTFDGSNCQVSDQSAITLNTEERAYVIVKPGTYVLSGNLVDAQVRVSVDKTEEVILIFNNFNAKHNSSAPIYITSCNKCIIELAPGSVNTLEDAERYVYADPTDDKPNACIYSADDLTIRGDGTLNIIANWNNGIGCKNDLRIKSGTITVSAPNNILKGNDSVTIDGGKVTLSGGEDAIKSDATDRTDKGFVLIEGDAKVTIDCSDDAIQASQTITVAAGSSVTVTAGGNALNCPGTINADASAMNIISEGAAEETVA